MDQKSTSSTQAKSRPAKKKSYKKKVQQEWTMEQTLQFIQEIEAKRCLWDTSCADYKLPKETVWKDVGDTVEMPVNECKAKWSNLRTTFNFNFEKLKKKKSGQRTTDNVSISWKFFKPMFFLKRNKVLQSTESTSSLELSTAAGDDRDFSQQLTGGQKTILNQSTNERKKRPRSSSPRTSSGEERHELKKMAIEALHKMHTNSPNALFGEYIASELNALPENQSTFVRSGLRDAFNNLMKQLPVVFPTTTIQPVPFKFDQYSSSNEF